MCALSPGEEKIFDCFHCHFISFLNISRVIKSEKKKRDIIRDLLRLNDMIDEMILFFHDFSELFGVRMSRKMQ